MKKLLIPATAAVVLALAALTLTGRSASQTSADTALDAEELAFTTLLNDYRVQNGLPPLLIDPDIQEATEWMSTDMGANNYFSHTDSLGQSPWTRMCNFGYCHNTSKGENIAAGYITGAQVFQGWKNSPGHNGNMLGVNFRVMGISRVYTTGSTYGWYWTNDFAGLVTSGAVPPGGPTSTPTAVPTPVPTATPSPAPTAAPGCSSDTDCDGWVDSQETYSGTNQLVRCSATNARNDEVTDAWPPDVNDDRRVNAFDILTFVGRLNSVAGDSLFTTRLDLNSDGRINTHDLIEISSTLNTPCV